MCNKLKIQNLKFKIASPVRCHSGQNLFFGICFFFFGISSNAQCAMCRAALESEGNTAKAEGVNDGIVYLMIIPYILVAGVGYYVYRMNRKKKV